jgi:diadenosine tetraphosphatase ApaH/serine/threonine PP2A family protein phosphatase
MRVLVISDIHANLTALDTVLADAGEVGAVWCLGDLVGYGPDPNECIERIRSLPNLLCLIGNHDAGTLGSIDVDSFNTDARLSILWTQKTINAENRAFLELLPERLVYGQTTLVHGSPRNPVWEYILEARIARFNFEYFETPYCFVGHSHLPVMYQYPNSHGDLRLAILDANQALVVQPRAILNPGSVGQPRDRDPRAAYAIFDTETNTWEQRRVSYDVHAVQERIRQAGLPERHAIRLAEGW